MKFKSIAIALALTVSTPAIADLTFPNLTYRTGAFAVSGIPYADGFADYMTLLNERDGGIGGEKVNNFPIFLRTTKFKIGYVPQYLSLIHI